MRNSSLVAVIGKYLFFVGWIGLQVHLAFAQPSISPLDSMQLPFFGKEKKIQPGMWVAYRLKLSDTSSATKQPLSYRFKISLPLSADSEHLLSRDQYWVELEFSQHGVPESDFIAIKLLLQGDPRQKDSIQQVFLGIGKRIPFKLPHQESPISLGSGSACAQDDPQTCAAKGGNIQKLSSKKIYTPMGWIEAQGVSMQFPEDKGHGEYWTSTRVPIFGIVKSTFVGVGKSTILELEGFGKGALSRIDESQAVLLPDSKELLKQLPLMK